MTDRSQELLAALKESSKFWRDLERGCVQGKERGFTKIDIGDLLLAVRHILKVEADASASRPERPVLFKSGAFTLHSGQTDVWKIDCDALTDGDWFTLAQLIAMRVGRFSAVEGVPTGGLKLASLLERYRSESGPVLVVDDVLTTGASMEQQRAGREAIGAVVFARGPVPSWVTPLFRLAAASASRAVSPEQQAVPALRWAVAEDDGGHLVQLDGFPNMGIVADGRTREEALHRLGDILFHAFNDACSEPEAHLAQPPEQQAVIKEMRAYAETVIRGGRPISVARVMMWADRLSAILQRSPQQEGEEEP